MVWERCVRGSARPTVMGRTQWSRRRQHDGLSQGAHATRLGGGLMHPASTLRAGAHASPEGMTRVPRPPIPVPAHARDYPSATWKGNPNALAGSRVAVR